MEWQKVILIEDDFPWASRKKEIFLIKVSDNFLTVSLCDQTGLLPDVFRCIVGCNSGHSQFHLLTNIQTSYGCAHSRWVNKELSHSLYQPLRIKVNLNGILVYLTIMSSPSWPWMLFTATLYLAPVNSCSDFFRYVESSALIYSLFFCSPSWGCLYFQMCCWHTVCQRQVYQIRNRYFAAVLRQDMAWFDKNESGALTTRMSE